MAEQNLQNHTRLVPQFHFFVLPMLVINVIFPLVRLFRLGPRPIQFNVLPLFVSVALLVGFVSVRTMVLRVQDRVIRLEERLRYERLLPEDLRPRISEFTTRQLISLRFASDAELPTLARKVLDEKLNDGKSIKQQIKNWRPDYLRA